MKSVLLSRWAVLFYMIALLAVALAILPAPTRSTFVDSVIQHANRERGSGAESSAGAWSDFFPIERLLVDPRIEAASRDGS